MKKIWRKKPCFIVKGFLRTLKVELKHIVTSPSNEIKRGQNLSRASVWFKYLKNLETRSAQSSARRWKKWPMVSAHSKNSL